MDKIDRKEWDYSCPTPKYWNQEHPMKTEKEIFRAAYEIAQKWYFVGVADGAWAALVEEFHKKLFEPYKKSDEPFKKLAHGLATAVCEYLQARAYDDRIPSRAALAKKQNEELKGRIRDVKPHKTEANDTKQEEKS